MIASNLFDGPRSILKGAKNLLCRKLCADCFFNRDASLEIDRLSVENEHLRARCAELELRDA